MLIVYVVPLNGLSKHFIGLTKLNGAINRRVDYFRELEFERDDNALYFL